MVSKQIGTEKVVDFPSLEQILSMLMLIAEYVGLTKGFGGLEPSLQLAVGF